MRSKGRVRPELHTQTLLPRARGHMFQMTIKGGDRDRFQRENLRMHGIFQSVMWTVSQNTASKESSLYLHHVKSNQNIDWFEPLFCWLYVLLIDTLVVFLESKKEMRMQNIRNLTAKGIKDDHLWHANLLLSATLSLLPALGCMNHATAAMEIPHPSHRRSKEKHGARISDYKSVTISQLN